HPDVGGMQRLGGGHLPCPVGSGLIWSDRGRVAADAGGAEAPPLQAPGIPGAPPRQEGSVSWSAATGADSRGPAAIALFASTAASPLSLPGGRHDGAWAGPDGARRRDWVAGVRAATLMPRLNRGTMARDIYVTEDDYERLENLVAATGGRDQAHVEQLAEELDCAHVVPASEIPPDVVTMGSQLELKDLDT